MATLHEISDPADPRLADYRDLRDVQMRKHLEAEHGLFLAEVAEDIEREQVRPPAIVVVGDVVAVANPETFARSGPWPT